ncbi:MAG: hypothetical protein A2V81_00950 [Candidatus Abawacabacteria bacterium RBG_16_42_10]|uniref:2,3-bisphosphoglycerate-independent phosphoglycerate mutase n=1 Tax=Candidatus Abawacabacteria bacterium RBG_16_42_10 TaxID=1817814 RepID=A0A1F4XLN7_9BACT|nr:MAG: hypothetical protein A2V81_00950 [Candidatus Abawacabacteria bacterium RBG_16_42_10]
MNTPALLIILDGFGIAPAGAGPGNAISLAKLPTLDRFQKGLYTELQAAGEAVGLPKGHQGSSEMGHLMIGAGRTVVFPQTQIKEVLEKNEIKNNQAYRDVMEYCQKNNKTLHLFGLLSDRGVHAYAELCYQLLHMAKDMDVRSVAVHIIADGRDTLPQELPKFVAELQKVMKDTGVGKIASLIGRYYAMDRDQRIERIEKAYELYTKGRGYEAKDINEFLREYYSSSSKFKVLNSKLKDKNLELSTQHSELPKADEFIPPVIFDKSLIMKEEDGVIFWNFRVDRAIEITQALLKMPLHFVATTEYYEGVKAAVAFAQEKISEPLGKILADHKVKQLRIAETEKWAYVTKVFDGYQEINFPLEDKMLIPSDKVKTYDLKPEMQAMEIAETIVEDLLNKKHEVIIANFANADMVGHTTSIPATIQGLEAMDKALAMIDQALLKAQGFMIITADHGNAEQMLTNEGKPEGTHTGSPVPLYIVNYNSDIQKRLKGASWKFKEDSGTLINVAPTFLDLLGIEVPPFMTNSLLT